MLRLEQRGISEFRGCIYLYRVYLKPPKAQKPHSTPNLQIPKSPSPPRPQGPKSRKFLPREPKSQLAQHGRKYHILQDGPIRYAVGVAKAPSSFMSVKSQLALNLQNTRETLFHNIFGLFQPGACSRGAARK